MTKFKSILSDDERLAISIEANIRYLENKEAHYGLIYSELVEQAVIAKLTDEQEPVAWFTEDHLTDRSATTYDPNVRDRWIAKGWPISPLYTHPCDSQMPDGTLTNEGTRGQHRSIENHIADTGKMIEHESHSLEFEVRTMVEMLEAKEWAEHCGKSDLGQRLEWAITSLHNEAQIIPKIIPDGWQLVPKEPSRDTLKKMFYEIFGMDGIEEEYLAARYRNMLSLFPKYTEVIND